MRIFDRRSILPTLAALSGMLPWFGPPDPGRRGLDAGWTPSMFIYISYTECQTASGD